MNYGVTDPQRLGQTKLPDGRNLAWAEWGPEEGAPGWAPPTRCLAAR